MLVLSRKHRESIVVGGAHGMEPVLTVTVLEINGASVRLGFEGNPDIPVHRLEVWERILSDGGLGRATGGQALPKHDDRRKKNKQAIE